MGKPTPIPALLEWKASCGGKPVNAVKNSPLIYTKRPVNSLNVGVTLALLLCASVFSQDSYTLKKTKEIQVDGVLGASEWENAINVPFLYEVTPNNNTPAKKETVAYITYDNLHLYIAVKAYDTPENIRASIRPRDDFKMLGDDTIFVALDPFTDARNNLLLGVNPVGSQLDARAVNATNDNDRYDTSFNVNYESAGQINAEGYVVEYKIPFSEIPFPGGRNQKWHFRIGRRYFENGNEVEIRTQTFDRDNPCLVCQTTQELVFSDITIAKRIEFLPYVTSSLVGERKSASIEYDPLNIDAGLGVNLDLSKNTALELTLNPDFSQVEADVTQVDVNSSFALEYPERRPFFSRGTGIVNFESDLFYTRAVNDPIFSGKLLNQGRKDRWYALAALDQNSPYRIAGEDRSYLGNAGQSFVSVIRYQYLITNKSRLGAFNMSRFYENESRGMLSGIDGLFLIGSNWRMIFEAALSQTTEGNQNWIESNDSFNGYTVSLDGESFRGHSVYFQAYRNTEHWKSYIKFQDISPNFRTDVGFVVKNNRRWATVYHLYQSISDRKGLQSYGFGTKADVNYTFQGYLKNISVDGIAQVKTFGNTDMTFTYDWDIFKNYLGVDYHYLGTLEWNTISRPSEQLIINTNLVWGKDLAYNEEIPDKGRAFNAFASVTYQLNDQFSINPSIRYGQLKRLEEDRFYFQGAISRLTLNYQYNNFLSLRIVGEYNEFADRFFIQPLVKWNPNPTTIFYIGGNQNTYWDQDGNFNPFQFTESQIYLKFQYLIGL